MKASHCLALRGNCEGEVFDSKQYARREAASARQNSNSLANRLKTTFPKREAAPHSLRECCSLPRSALEGRARSLRRGCLTRPSKLG